MVSLKRICEYVSDRGATLFLGNEVAEVRKENLRLRREVEQYRRSADEAYRDGKDAILLLTAKLKAEKSITDRLDRALRQSEDDARRLRLLAHNDPLTGLLNRRGVTDHLAGIASALWHTARHGDDLIPGKPLVCSIVYIDLDNFKPVNDTLGHDAGDAILAGVAKLLTKTFSRKADLVARFGGDEFVVVMTHSDREGAARQAEQFLLELEQDPHFLRVGCNISVGASIGVAPMILYPEAGGLSADTLETVLESAINRADAAMYVSKQSGKGRVSIERRTTHRSE